MSWSHVSMEDSMLDSVYNRTRRGGPIRRCSVAGGRVASRARSDLSPASVWALALLVSFLILWPAGASWAQKSLDSEEGRLRDMTLEELLNVVVSAAKRVQDLASVPATIKAITEDDIELSSAFNLAELLRSLPGVIVERHPGNLPQYRTVVRGFSSDFMNERTLLMIDGLPIYHPSSGGIDPGWLSLSPLKRVEVIKGPASALYGANAFGGLINLITKTPEGDRFTGNLSLGVKTRKNLDSESNEQVPFVSANVSGRIGAGDLLLAADGYFDLDGYTERFVGERLADGFGKLGYQVSDRTRISITAMLSTDEQRIGFDYAPEPLVNRTRHLAAVLDSHLSDRYQLQVRTYLNSFRNDVLYDNELTGYFNRGRVLGIEIQNTLELGRHLLVFGADARKDRSSLATWEFDWSGGWPPPVTPAGWGEETSRSAGIYLQEEYLGLGKLRPILGIRYDSNSEFGDSVSPRIGLSYQLAEGMYTYLTVAKAFRAPNFNELFINGFGKIGNPDLEPERTIMYEVGLRRKREGTPFSYDLSVFRHEVKDMIFPLPIDPDNPFSLGRYVNVGQAAIDGVEGEVQFELPHGVSPFLNITLLDTDDGNGRELEKVPETKVVVGFKLRHNKYEALLLARYRSDAYFFNPNPDVPSNELGQLVLDDITTVDLLVAKSFLLGSAPGELCLSLFAENLTDKEYTESFAPWVELSSRRLPGRTLGLRLRWDFR